MAETPTLVCEKCKSGSMTPAKVARFSTPLRIVGFAMWPSALLVVAFLGILAISNAGEGSPATRQAAASFMREQKVPEYVVGDYIVDGDIDGASYRALPQEQKSAVLRAASLHRMRVGGVVVGEVVERSAEVSLAGFGLAALVALPFVILGPNRLVLTAKRKVWRCPTCTYVFERS